ncbi:cytochrome P450 [Streptomyces sp. NPDC052013]|uniref:cytochrome P450 n=1 Tax=Streptomyces sp. NPDC052013 TaxID=3365679 RepID=UPI0037D41CCE
MVNRNVRESAQAMAEKPASIPARRLMPRLAQGPLQALELAAGEASCRPVRLNFGPVRPYLITHPEHIQHVLRDQAGNYPRGRMMWKPLERLTADVAGEGPSWVLGRQLFQPLLSARSISALSTLLTDAIVQSIDDLAARARQKPRVDAGAEMTRIVQRVVIKIFFGNRIPQGTGDRLARAVDTAFRSMRIRMMLPFVPGVVPMPGDQSLRRSIQTVDDVMFSVIHQARSEPPGQDGDFVSQLLLHQSENGAPLTDRQIRDFLVSLFVGGVETSAVALTWLWVVLDTYPEVAVQLEEEIHNVVGNEQPGLGHLKHLTYTKMVVQELLRLYPVGWLIPRTVLADDVIDGVLIKARSTILVSPYLTQRLPEIWSSPDVFNPRRFAPENVVGRHPRSYIPFGAGPHTCLGSYLFIAEAQLIIAALLRRFRPVLLGDASRIEPTVSLTLRPRQQVALALHPGKR